jgi:Tol biopolymer transport system component
MRPDGSDLRRLTTGSSRILGWLPGGQQLAVMTPRAGDSVALLVADVRGENETRPVFTIPGIWTSARLSPDGQSVAYIRSEEKLPRNGPEEFRPIALEVVGLADGSTRRILDGQFTFLNWAPDSKRLAVQVGPGDIESQKLEIVSLDEPPGLTQIGTGTSPMWSPTGNRIVFGSRTSADSRSTMSLFVVGADGGAPLRIASNFPGGFEPELLWSPDDAFIIADGGYAPQLLRYSVFSPDLPKVLGPGMLPQLDTSGQRVACFSWEEGGKHAVEVLDIDGTGQRLLHRGIDYFDTTLSWSPDSRLIAYAASEGKAANTGIYTADVATGEHRLLFDELTWEWQPIWSPDGKWIAFVREGPPRS